MLFYKVPEKKQKDKNFFGVCTSHVTGKDNTKDFFFYTFLDYTMGS